MRIREITSREVRRLALQGVDAKVAPLGFHEQYSGKAYIVADLHKHDGNSDPLPKLLGTILHEQMHGFMNFFVYKS